MVRHSISAVLALSLSLMVACNTSTGPGALPEGDAVVLEEVGGDTSADAPSVDTNDDATSGDASGDTSVPPGDGASDVAVSPLSFITVSPPSPELNVGGTVDLVSTGNFADGTSISPYDSELVWTSSAPSVATVSGTGLVTGLSAGVATIAAAKGGIQAFATVRVSTATRTLTGIDLNPKSMTLTKGSVRDIAADALWSDGTGSSGFDGSVTWTSDRPTVATVSNLGNVTAIEPGTAIITASASGRSATCTVTVTAATVTLTSLAMSPATGSLRVGETLRVKPVGTYSDGSSRDIVPVTTVAMTTSNAAVATVDVYGFITAKGVGTATISGTLSGKSGSTTVSVVAAPTFDARLVGKWQWIGVPDSSGTNYGSFYQFNADGTFSYDLIYQVGAGSCITTSKVVAHHEGRFATEGSLDNPMSAGKIVFTCTAHFTDYTNCSGAVSRTTWTGTNPHFHWGAFSGSSLITNHADDFNPTGNLTHVRY